MVVSRAVVAVVAVAWVTRAAAWVREATKVAVDAVWGRVAAMMAAAERAERAMMAERTAAVARVAAAVVLGASVGLMMAAVAAVMEAEKMAGVAVVVTMVVATAVTVIVVAMGSEAAVMMAVAMGAAARVAVRVQGTGVLDGAEASWAPATEAEGREQGKGAPWVMVRVAAVRVAKGMAKGVAKGMAKAVVASEGGTVRAAVVKGPAECLALGYAEGVGGLLKAMAEAEKGLEVVVMRAAEMGYAGVMGARAVETVAVAVMLAR